MFEDVKVGDQVTRNVTEIGKKLTQISAKVVEVREDTFVAEHFADVMTKVEYRKSDGQNTIVPGDTDYGYVTK